MKIEFLIDSNNHTQIEVSSEDQIDYECNKLIEKYKINSNIKGRLINYIKSKMHYEIDFPGNEQNDFRKEVISKSIEKLYGKSAEHKKMIKESLNMKYKNTKKDELKECTFTPCINNKVIKCIRLNLHPETRLFYQDTEHRRRKDLLESCMNYKKHLLSNSTGHMPLACKALLKKNITSNISSNKDQMKYSSKKKRNHYYKLPSEIDKSLSIRKLSQPAQNFITNHSEKLMIPIKLSVLNNCLNLSKDKKLKIASVHDSSNRVAMFSSVPANNRKFSSIELLPSESIKHNSKSFKKIEEENYFACIKRSSMMDTNKVHSEKRKDSLLNDKNFALSSVNLNSYAILMKEPLKEINNQSLRRDSNPTKLTNFQIDKKIISKNSVDVAPSKPYCGSNLNAFCSKCGNARLEKTDIYYNIDSSEIKAELRVDIQNKSAGISRKNSVNNISNITGNSTFRPNLSNISLVTPNMNNPHSVSPSLQNQHSHSRNKYLSSSLQLVGSIKDTKQSSQTASNNTQAQQNIQNVRSSAGNTTIKTGLVLDLRESTKEDKRKKSSLKHSIQQNIDNREIFKVNPNPIDIVLSVKQVNENEDKKIEKSKEIKNKKILAKVNELDSKISISNANDAQTKPEAKSSIANVNMQLILKDFGSFRLASNDIPTKSLQTNQRQKETSNEFYERLAVINSEPAAHKPLLKRINSERDSGYSTKKNTENLALNMNCKSRNADIKVEGRAHNAFNSNTSNNKYINMMSSSSRYLNHRLMEEDNSQKILKPKYDLSRLALPKFKREKSKLVTKKNFSFGILEKSKSQHHQQSKTSLTDAENCTLESKEKTSVLSKNMLSTPTLTNKIRQSKFCPKKVEYSISDYKKEKILSGSLEKLKKQKKETKTQNKNYINNKIQLFKLNRLKEIFELIFDKCQRFRDIHELEKYGVSTSLKEQLIIPTLNHIKNNKLEFNFKNFYLVSSQMLSI